MRAERIRHWRRSWRCPKTWVFQLDGCWRSRTSEKRNARSHSSAVRGGDSTEFAVTCSWSEGRCSTDPVYVQRPPSPVERQPTPWVTAPRIGQSHWSIPPMPNHPEGTPAVSPINPERTSCIPVSMHRACAQQVNARSTAFTATGAVSRLARCTRAARPRSPRPPSPRSARTASAFRAVAPERVTCPARSAAGARRSRRSG